MKSLYNYVTNHVWDMANLNQEPDYTHLIYCLAEEIDELRGPTYGPMLEETEGMS